jgi:hypothetical protein
MTNATHTPAPWRIVTDGISHWIEIEPNKIALIHAKKADRDLIAAAPDLLAACEAMAAQLGSGDDYSKWENAKAQLLAAITKAKGA